MVVLAFESVKEILNCNHSNESNRAIQNSDVVRFSVVQLLRNIIPCFELREYREWKG